MNKKLAIKWVLKNCKFAAGNPFAFDPTPPKAKTPGIAPASQSPIAPAAPAVMQDRTAPLQPKIDINKLYERLKAIPFNLNQKGLLENTLRTILKQTGPAAAEKWLHNMEQQHIMGLANRMDTFVYTTLKSDPAMIGMYEQMKKTKGLLATQIWLSKNNPNWAS
jgi:hypothetical protein